MKEENKKLLLIILEFVIIILIITAIIVAYGNKQEPDTINDAPKSDSKYGLLLEPSIQIDGLFLWFFEDIT